MDQITVPPGEDYLTPYRHALTDHGPSFATTLWRSRRTQEVRFEVLRTMVDLTGMRLLDAGSGLGDLLDYLERHDVALGRYIGIEGLEAVVDRARSRHGSSAEFHSGDFVADTSLLARGEPDLIFFSGSLNTVPEKTAREVVAHAFACATRGVVFNFLSDRCPAPMRNMDTAPARRFDTIGWFKWATDLTANVQLRQDYLNGHDATIGMFHEQSGSV